MAISLNIINLYFSGAENSYPRKIHKSQKPTATDAQFVMRNVSKTTMNQSIKVNSNIGK